MKAVYAVFNLIAVLLCTILGVIYFNISRTLEKDFDSQRLGIAVDNATQAAFRQGLVELDTGISYSLPTIEGTGSFIPALGDMKDEENIPALRAFCDVMCLSYGMGVRQEKAGVEDHNYKLVEESIAVAVITGYDGFYVTQVGFGKDSEGCDVIDFDWGPKIPYFGDTDGNERGTNGSYFTLNDSNDETEEGMDETERTERETRRNNKVALANKQVAEAMRREIVRRNLNNTSFEFNFYMPSMTTANGVNPITGPGILVFVQNATYASKYSIDAISVSGYKVVHKKTYVGFELNGVKYYSYEGKLPDGVDATANFESMEEAAASGYWPHTSYMMG